MKLTAHDKEHIRETARDLREAWQPEDDELPSETVMLSTGYAEVQIDPDDEDNIEVVQYGEVFHLPLDPDEDEGDDDDS